LVDNPKKLKFSNKRWHIEWCW